MSGLTNNFDSVGTGLDVLYQTIVQTDYTQKLQPTKDTTSVSEVKPDILKGIYTALSSRPQLEKALAGFDPAGVNTLLNLLQNFPEQVLIATNTLPTVPEDKFSEEMESEIDALGEKKLAEIGGGDAAKGKQMVRYAILHNDANFPPEIKELAAGILAKATATAGNGPSAAFVALEDKALSTINTLNFQGIVVLAKLTDEEQAHVYFAFFVPEAADALPANLQKILKEAKAAANAETQKSSGVPSDWKATPDREGFLRQIGDELGSSVEDKIAEYALKNKLPRSQMNEMKAILYGDTNTPHAATLKAVVAQFLQEATGKLQGEFGFPEGFTPPLNSVNFEAVLNGAFGAEFTKQLGNPSLNLTAEQKSLLKGALISKDAEAALPEELKTVFKNIEGMAIAKIIASYGVSSTWMPKTEMQATMAANMSNPSFLNANNMLNQAKEWISTGNKMLVSINAEAQAGGGVPPPSNGLLMKYLSAVNSVLIKMSEMLYEISITDSNLSVMMNKIQNDSEIGRLKKQEKELKEVLEKEKKMESMGPLKAIFQWIINLILMLFLGPVGVLLIAAMMTKTVVDAKKSGKDIGKAMMDFNVVMEVTKTIGEIGKSIGGPFGNALANIGKAVALIAMIVFCPLALLADLMISDAVFIKELAMAFGADKKTAEKIAMAVQITFQVVAMIVLAVFTGGATVEISVFGIMKSVAQMALSVVKTVKGFFANIGNFIKQLFASSSTQIQTSVAKSALAAAKAEVPPDAAKIAAAQKEYDLAFTAEAEVTQKLKDAGNKILDAIVAFFSFSETQGTTGATQAGSKGTQATEGIEGGLQQIVNTLGTRIETLEKAEVIGQATRKLEIAAGIEAKANEALTAAKASGDASRITQAEQALTKATEEVTTATANLKKAGDEAQEAASIITNKVQIAMDLAQTIPAVCQDIVSVHNNIIEAQIIRIKAAMDEAKELIGAFVKILKDLVAKLMAMVTAAGKDIKAVGDQIRHMFAGAADAIENMCRA